MRIIFLLPSGGGRPIGGFKVVYEYANRLAGDGYDVGIVYPAYCFKYKQNSIIGILRLFKALIRFLVFMVSKKYSCPGWFKLDKRVKEYWVWSLNESFVPKSDSYVATAVHTAVYLNGYKRISADSKFYLIQHFENWGGATNNDIIESYHYPMHKIVIANWLKNIVNSVGENCCLIPNGFDFTYFQKSIDVHLRDKFTICMLYHLLDWKGCSDGFKALDIVKEGYPNLKVNIFGVPSRPKDLPDWYEYYQQPDRETHNRIYNESAIFIGTSWSEGWGLTVGEAMICGCAVACTDNLGYLEMATDGETALVSPVHDPESLALNIIRLIEDDDLRYYIAEEGNRNIQQFNWESAYDKFKLFINDPKI